MACCGSENKGTAEPLKYDPNFRGPLSKRSCTDLPCLLLFIAFLGAWGFVAHYAVQHGDLNRLLVPIDSDGRKCGIDSEVQDAPYLVFFNITECAKIEVPISGCKTTQVCVNECPTENIDFDIQSCNNAVFSQFREKLVCKTSVNKGDMKTCQDIQKKIGEDLCAQFIRKSTSLANRCISNIDKECPRESKKIQTCKEKLEIGNILQENPSKLESFLAKYVNNLVSFLTNGKVFHKTSQMIVEDILQSWPIIVGFIGISVLASLILITMLRWIAKPLVWISIIGVIAALSYGVYYSYREYKIIIANPTDSHVNVSPNLSSLINSWFKSDQTWLIILIVLSVFLVILLLVVLVLRKRIVIAIALIKEGSKAVSACYTSVFFPIAPWLLQAAVLVFSLVVLLFLASIGDPVYKIAGLNSSSCVCNNGYKEGDLCDPIVFNEKCSNRNDQTRCLEAACRFMEVKTPQIVGYYHALNVLGFFWGICFVSAFSEMVLAFTFATWYWTKPKARVPFFVMTRGIMLTLFYHLGTLAFGSLIIAICKIIRACLEYVDHKLKGYDNGVTRAILCCCRCFFWCLENFLKFLNQNAYIMCAIYGKNFCSSAKDAFSLLTRNVLRVIALDKVMGFLFFLSKLVLSCGMASVTYVLFESDILPTTLNFSFVPAVLVFIGTFIIASIFFSVYSVAVDTLFLCFLEDSERNDGSPERPFYMSKGLLKILGKKNVPTKSQPN
ncbi:choline transporter-like 2 isoform X2 [Anopheles ziemanni]|uniref:choline transporter-like 2 isoform X2 n=1 Tax=Anopheles coustani TaxID=139045 RepID=UPI0026596698|nr:choline transporter-like 2 isoform X2 [Anopheles coustani]XP_058168835.1 choline transporter-like 2 isoform X2 [Anopheles ziemanni]